MPQSNSICNADHCAAAEYRLRGKNHRTESIRQQASRALCYRLQ